MQWFFFFTQNLKLILSALFNCAKIRSQEHLEQKFFLLFTFLLLRIIKTFHLCSSSSYFYGSVVVEFSELWKVECSENIWKIKKMERIKVRNFPQTKLNSDARRSETSLNCKWIPKYKFNNALYEAIKQRTEQIIKKEHFNIIKQIKRDQKV